jgi:hypothetical protein
MLAVGFSIRFEMQYRLISDGIRYEVLVSQQEEMEMPRHLSNA